MAVTQAKDLTIVRSDVAAELVAAAIAQFAAALPGSTPIVESARRLLLRHAHELCELHGLKPSEVLSVSSGGEGGGDFVQSTYNES